MAYVAWSVVFGEQPTAAKWNILGTNDASFHDGTGIDDDVILTRHLIENFAKSRYKETASNSSESGLLFQYGHHSFVGNSTATYETTITLPQAYTTLLAVGGTFVGAKSGAIASNIKQYTTTLTSSGITIHARPLNDSSFELGVSRQSGTLVNTSSFGAAWWAIGIK